MPYSMHILFMATWWLTRVAVAMPRSGEGDITREATVTGVCDSYKRNIVLGINE
jgi:hypothetical protein